jgi:adenine-specific DNA-methyltransferase
LNKQTRVYLSQGTEAKKKSQFGQFLTPERTAAFLASLFPSSDGHCRLLDAGAGIGSLSVAFLDRWKSDGFHFQSVSLDAFEIDPALHDSLSRKALVHKKQSGRIPLSLIFSGRSDQPF